MNGLAGGWSVYKCLTCTYKTQRSHGPQNLNRLPRTLGDLVLEGKARVIKQIDSLFLQAQAYSSSVRPGQPMLRARLF